MRKLFLIMMTLVASVLAVQAQTRTYRGSVVDAANGEPLIGATVLPIGGGQGAATDVEGNFSITVPEKVHTARISYVGYAEKTVTLKDNMVVSLESTTQNLDQVVVVAYGTASKESLTGSVAVVDAKKIEDRPVTSVTAALEGNAPGVQVNNSTGYPGSSPTIRIRGFNSFQDNAPLYVVDGIVYQGDIADLNPADIESMSVLKDAASCALYGNRGANGVILITTKRAKGKGKVEVNLQVRQGMYNRGLPFYDTLGANDWMETSLRGWANGRVSAGGFDGFPEEQRFQQALNTCINQFNSYTKGTNPYGVTGNQLFDENGRIIASVQPGYNDLDWWKAVSRSGHRQEYTVSAAGASDKFDVMTSVGYLKENGYMLQTDFERFTGRVVANYQPVKYFRMGLNLVGSYQDSQVSQADPEELGLVTNPFLVMYNAPILPYYVHNEDGSLDLDSHGRPQWNTAGLARGNNIAWSMRLDDSSYQTLSVNGNLYGTAILPYGFELTVRGAMMRSKEQSKDYSNNVTGSQAGVGGLDLLNTGVASHTFMQTLTWAQSYGLNNIDVLLNHENYQYGYDQTFFRKSGQLLPDNTTVGNFESDDASAEAIAKIRTESYLGRARYNYDQRYFGEFSFRRDGTSRFSKNRRWGNFWSVGASWIITREKFMAPTQNWLDYLKLRLAYGSVGNDAAASAYAYWALYSFRQYDGAGALVPAQVAADDIRWESTKTLDIALEGSIFNDRFNWSVGYFDKRNADLLYNVTRPASAGTLGNSGSLIKVLSNVGTMSNRGWELAFGVDIIRNAEFKWSFNLDATFIKNKIVKLPNGRDIVGQALFQGYSLYEHYDYKWAGIDTSTGKSLYEMCPDSPDYYSYNENNELVYDNETYEKNVADAIADDSYVVINGKAYTNKTQYAGRTKLGTALSTVTGSFGTSLSWKGINFSLLFTYGLGGKTMDDNYKRLMSPSVDSPGALHSDLLKAWTPANATADPAIDPNGVPEINTTTSEYNDASSSRWLKSNNYVTLKNIVVSYDLPKKWSQAMLLQNINIGFSADNLFIATCRKGMNPTYGFGGGQGAYFVPARVFSFQLGVRF